MELEPTTFELEFQPANPLRHKGCAKFAKSIKAKDLKTISAHFKNNLQIFFESKSWFLEG